MFFFIGKATFYFAFFLAWQRVQLRQVTTCQGDFLVEWNRLCIKINSVWATCKTTHMTTFLQWPSLLNRQGDRQNVLITTGIRYIGVLLHTGFSITILKTIVCRTDETLNSLNRDAPLVNKAGMSGAPYLRKYGNSSSRENLVITRASVNSVRPWVDNISLSIKALRWCPHVI